MRVQAYWLVYHTISSYITPREGLHVNGNISFYSISTVKSVLNCIGTVNRTYRTLEAGCQIFPDSGPQNSVYHLTKLQISIFHKDSYFCL